jgi:hypothetical protein
LHLQVLEPQTTTAAVTRYATAVRRTAAQASEIVGRVRSPTPRARP